MKQKHGNTKVNLKKKALGILEMHPQAKNTAWTIRFRSIIVPDSGTRHNLSFFRGKSRHRPLSWGSQRRRGTHERRRRRCRPRLPTWNSSWNGVMGAKRLGRTVPSEPCSGQLARKALRDGRTYGGERPHVTWARRQAR